MTSPGKTLRHLSMGLILFLLPVCSTIAALPWLSRECERACKSDLLSILLANDLYRGPGALGSILIFVTWFFLLQLSRKYADTSIELFCAFLFGTIVGFGLIFFAGPSTCNQPESRSGDCSAISKNAVRENNTGESHALIARRSP